MPEGGIVPRALTIAGSDSGGGAGVQADLKTFQALGVYGMTAITAVTVQNTKGVSGYVEIPAGTVGEQIFAVVSDIGVDAVKTGMLSSAAIIVAVAEAVAETALSNLVVDPVFVSKHGHSLLREDAVQALKTRLLPLATLVTPNLHEAAGLAGFPVATDQDMEKAGQVILDLGPEAVLVKGGHREGEQATDLLITRHGIQPFSTDRIDTPYTHGTGCVLSAAITSYLARGEKLVDAIAQGKDFVTEAIRHGRQLGEGIGPVDPSWGLNRR